jgi:DNA-binding MarR family transcriptional regulator
MGGAGDDTPARAVAGAECLDTRVVAALDATIPRYLRAIRLAIEQAEGEGRLTMPQLHCLQAMAATGTTRTTHLARRMQVSVPTMTGRIDGLVERGLVERRPDPADRRQVRLTLTPAGHRLLGRYQAIMDARLRELLVHLAPEGKARLLLALEDVAAMLDADADGVRHASVGMESWR